MGWRMTATFLPRALRYSQTLRVVWLLPQPVRTAQTAMTGFLEGSMVCFQPMSRKSAPAALTMEALCMTSRWLRSE